MNGGVNVLVITERASDAKQRISRPPVAKSAATGGLGGTEPMTDCVEPAFVDGGLTDVEFTRAPYICIIGFRECLRVLR